MSSHANRFVDEGSGLAYWQNPADGSVKWEVEMTPEEIDRMKSLSQTSGLDSAIESNLSTHQQPQTNHFEDLMLKNSSSSGERYLDPETGYYYFVDSVTGEVKWDETSPNGTATSTASSNQTTTTTVPATAVSTPTTKDLDDLPNPFADEPPNPFINKDSNKEVG